MKPKTKKLLFEMIEWAEKNRLYCDMDLHVHGKNPVIKFGCQLKSYKNAHSFVKKFKIKLQKNIYGEDNLEYEGKIDEIEIDLYAVKELPPSCKIVKVKKTIPAIEYSPAKVMFVKEIVCN